MAEPTAWEMTLRCGCTIQTVVNGIAHVAMFDGISGFNVKCPTHGWTLRVQ